MPQRKSRGRQRRQRSDRKPATAAVAAPATAPVELSPNLSNLLGEFASLRQAAANASHMDKISRTSVRSVQLLSPESSPAVFEQAFALYVESFPIDDEREPTEMIRQRIADMPDVFYCYAFLDQVGTVIGYCQGSICSAAGSPSRFFYMQYCCVSPQSRGGGVLQLMHAVCAATLLAFCKRANVAAIGTVWEAEPVGMADEAEARKYTVARLSIHSKAGGRVIMGKRADGTFVVRCFRAPRRRYITNAIGAREVECVHAA